MTYTFYLKIFGSRVTFRKGTKPAKKADTHRK